MAILAVIGFGTVFVLWALLKISSDCDEWAPSPDGETGEGE